jgi:hypothetical protein
MKGLAVLQCEDVYRKFSKERKCEKRLFENKVLRNWAKREKMQQDYWRKIHYLYFITCTLHVKKLRRLGQLGGDKHSMNGDNKIYTHFGH